MSRIANVIFVLLAMSCLGCKPKAVSSVKTLENFAAGKRLRTNVCEGDAEQRRDKEDLIQAVTVVPKAASAGGRAAVAKVLSAVPEPLLEFFTLSRGQIHLVGDAEAACRKALKVEEAAAGRAAQDMGREPLSSCLLQSMREGDPARSKDGLHYRDFPPLDIIVADDPAVIQHYLLKQFGLMLYVNYNFLEAKLDEDGRPSVVTGGAGKPGLLAAADAVINAYLKDIARSAVFDVKYLDLYLGKNAGAALDTYMLGGDTNWVADGRRFEDVLKAAMPKRDPKVIDRLGLGFRALVVAESFDSYFCNAAGSFDEDAVGKVAMGFFKSIDEVGAVLGRQKNTRQIMRALFPRTHEAFRHEMVGFLKQMAPKKRRVASSDASSGRFGLTDPEVLSGAARARGQAYWNEMVQQQATAAMGRDALILAADRQTMRVNFERKAKLIVDEGVRINASERLAAALPQWQTLKPNEQQQVLEPFMEVDYSTVALPTNPLFRQGLNAQNPFAEFGNLSTGQNKAPVRTLRTNALYSGDEELNLRLAHTLSRVSSGQAVTEADMQTVSLLRENAAPRRGALESQFEALQSDLVGFETAQSAAIPGYLEQQRLSYRSKFDASVGSQVADLKAKFKEQGLDYAVEGLEGKVMNEWRSGELAPYDGAWVKDLAAWKPTSQYRPITFEEATKRGGLPNDQYSYGQDVKNLVLRTSAPNPSYVDPQKQDQAMNEAVRTANTTATLDTVQAGLTVGGAVPLIGEPLDLINGGISEARGDHVGAALDFASAIPIGGYAATTAKVARRTGASLFDAATEAAKSPALRKLSIGTSAGTAGVGVTRAVYNYNMSNPNASPEDELAFVKDEYRRTTGFSPPEGANAASLTTAIDAFDVSRSSIQAQEAAQAIEQGTMPADFGTLGGAGTVAPDQSVSEP